MKSDQPATMIKGPVELAAEALFQTLLDSTLVTPEEIDAAMQGHELASIHDVDALAERLVAQGKLTTFQLDAIKKRELASLAIGNYDVLDRLGAGGMGTVFKARHRRMKRIVALKVMAKELCQDDRYVKRFQREVETIARLNHPNIVLAFDADEADAGHFLVMEFVDGRDLMSLVQDNGPFSLRDAVSCIVQAAYGLEYAHKQNIIHRDIKPANLLRDPDGVLKITDLGLARLNTEAGVTGPNSGLTQAGGIVGTVDYMSPEQAFDSTSVDQRADIYSLGCTLYFLLAGAPPFTGSSLMATLVKHRESPIPDLAAARPDAPAELAAVIRRSMAKKPADRFQSMGEFAAALLALDLPDAAPPQRPELSAPTEKPTVAKNVLSTSFKLSGESSPSPPDGGQTVSLDKSPVNAAATSLSVLLVEPSRTQAGIVRRFLHECGIEKVVVAVSGREAIEAIRKTPIDAVVSAMHLDDMTGVNLAHQLWAEHKQQKPGFLLVSTASQSEATASFSKVANSLILTKPFTIAQLAEALGKVTKRSVHTTDVSLSQAPATDAKSAVRSRLKVLLVDDSAAARLHERGILQTLGFCHFTEAADGAQAVAVTAQEQFDLIVTDYNMPHMDGRGLVGYLRQNPITAKTPIILVTTETDPAKLDEVRRLGASAICDKTFAPDVVRPILDRLLG